MRSSTLRAALPLAILAAGFCPASVYAEDSCEDVLRYAAKNNSLLTYYDQVSYSMYRENCGSSQSSAGLGVTIKGAPLSFNTDSQSTFLARQNGLAQHFTSWPTRPATRRA